MPHASCHCSRGRFRRAPHTHVLAQRSQYRVRAPFNSPCRRSLSTVSFDSDGWVAVALARSALGCALCQLPAEAALCGCGGIAIGIVVASCSCAVSASLWSVVCGVCRAWGVGLCAPLR
jgi:hypothetical protein